MKKHTCKTCIYADASHADGPRGRCRGLRVIPSGWLTKAGEWHRKWIRAGSVDDALPDAPPCPSWGLIPEGVCPDCRDSANAVVRDELQPCDGCGGSIIATGCPTCPSCLTRTPWPVGAPLIEMEHVVRVPCEACGVEFRCLPYLRDIFLCQPYIDLEPCQTAELRR